MNPARRTALITGASAGIGEAFARALAASGHNLILTARRKSRLEDLADELSGQYGVEVLCLPADLSAPSAPETLLIDINQQSRHIDMLVNNAGYGLPGMFSNTSWEDQRDFLQVMLTAPTELCHRLIPSMTARGYGRIINVASLVSFTPGSKGHTLYGPVKAALMRLSESLNAETKGSGIHVTAVCPGLTYSEFHDVNGQRDRVSSVPRFMWQSADEVVETALKAVEANRPVVVTGGVNKVIAGLFQILPDPIGRALMSQQSSRFRQAD